MGTAFDLSDPKLLFRDEVLADPGPLYDQLRREAPVWQVPGQDTFLVSDPVLIREAVGRPSEFSSNLVSLLYQDEGGCPVAFDMAPLDDPIHVLAVADPPAHAVHRRLLQPHLSPDAVKALEEPIRLFADDRLNPLLAAGGGDIVEGCHVEGDRTAAFVLVEQADQVRRELSWPTDRFPNEDGI